MTRFRATTLALGAVLTFGPALRILTEVPEAELGAELPLMGFVTLVLYSPYVLLAVGADGARPLVAYGALALIAAATGAFYAYAAATSDAQGGFVILYILPFQYLVAWLASARRFTRPG